MGLDEIMATQYADESLHALFAGSINSASRLPPIFYLSSAVIYIKNAYLEELFESCIM
jgi:hypothetical protein